MHVLSLQGGGHGTVGKWHKPLRWSTGRVRAEFRGIGISFPVGGRRSRHGGGWEILGKIVIYSFLAVSLYHFVWFVDVHSADIRCWVRVIAQVCV